MPISEAASMPPNTGVPTARRLIAPAPLGDHQGHEAGDEREAGHHHRPETQARALDRGLDDRLAVLALLLGELDDQDGVLGGERDQHDQADLAVDVEAQAGDDTATRAPSTPTLTESSTGIGMFQLSYSATRNR